MKDKDARIERIGELADDIENEEYHLRTEDALARDDYEEFAALIYEYKGVAGVLQHLFTELSELESQVSSIQNADAVAEYGVNPEKYRERGLRAIHEDYLRSIRTGLLALAEQELPRLHGNETGDEYQALVSPTERKTLRGGSSPEKKHTVARIRRRITERFAEDIALLKEESPQLYDVLRELVLEDIDHNWTPDDFAPGDRVRLEGGDIGIVDRVIVQSGGTIKLELTPGSLEDRHDAVVPVGDVIEVL